MSKPRAVFIGSLNTDFLALGLDEFPSPGQHVYGKTFDVAAGGKSRNAANMAANLLEDKQVVMVGITVEDEKGLYKVPLEALKNAGVDTRFVRVEKPSKKHPYPSIAIVAVDTEGQNRIIVFPGIAHDFNKKHIDELIPLFKEIGNEGGLVCLGLEAPLETVLHAKSLAKKYGCKVILDPGGVKKNEDYSRLIDKEIFLIKPNEYEASILTGISVTDVESATLAAKKLSENSIDHVLITLGDLGAVLLSSGEVSHIEIPNIESEIKDSVGCGDQALGALVSRVLSGDSIKEAAEIAVLAGTLQFTKPGVVPLNKEDFKRYLF